jgi:hypothetical protein
MKSKKKLVDLYNQNQETSDECYEAFDDFIDDVCKSNNTNWNELTKFQEKTKNHVINEYYNDIITFLEMHEEGQYQLNLCLDRFIDIVSVYASAIEEREETFELSETKNDVTWQQAMDYAVELGEGWRLPTKEELAIIANSPRSKEITMYGWFWSSSTDVSNTYDAWAVGFPNGYVSFESKSHAYNARYIRGSFKDIIEWCFGKEEKC